MLDKNTKYSSSNLNKYQSNHPIAGPVRDNFFRKLILLIKMVEHSHILNLGCGEGFDLKNIFEQGNLRFEYCCGFDKNMGALRFANKILAHFGFNSVNGDIYNLPFNLNRFNMILCLEVLEHLANPEKILQTVEKEYNGHCIFSVPNEPLYRLARLVILRQNLSKLGNHPEHLNNWTKKGFCRLIEKYFVIDNVFTPFPYTVVLCHNRKI